MNQVILQAQVKTVHRNNHTGDSKKTLRFVVEVAPYKEGDEPIILEATTWGKVAEDAEATIQEEKYVVLEGSLRLNKNSPPALNVTAFHLVMPEELPGVNAVSLVGRVGQSPKVRYFESGKAVANLSLAVNRIRRDDPPDWFNLEIWGKQANVAADYVHKGSMLGINGSAYLQAWTDKTTGEKRNKICIRVNRLELLGSRSNNESSADTRQNDNQEEW